MPIEKYEVSIEKCIQKNKVSIKPKSVVYVVRISKNATIE